MNDSKAHDDALKEEFEKAQIFSPDDEKIHQDAAENSEEEESPNEDVQEESDLSLLQQEIKDERNKYFRLLAELENTRKRLQKEKEEMMRFTTENVVADFLIPLDQLETALGFADQASEDVKNWAKGFEMILTQFKDVLSQHKITSFSSVGKPFDPHEHEVIEMVETTEHEPNTVIQEFAKGYRSNDRIIRPARVKLAKSPEQQESKNKEMSNE